MINLCTLSQYIYFMFLFFPFLLFHFGCEWRRIAETTLVRTKWQMMDDCCAKPRTTIICCQKMTYQRGGRKRARLSFCIISVSWNQIPYPANEKKNKKNDSTRENRQVQWKNLRMTLYTSKSLRSECFSMDFARWWWWWTLILYVYHYPVISLTIRCSVRIPIHSEIYLNIWNDEAFRYCISNFSSIMISRKLKSMFDSALFVSRILQFHCTNLRWKCIEMPNRKIWISMDFWHIAYKCVPLVQSAYIVQATSAFCQTSYTEEKETARSYTKPFDRLGCSVANRPHLSISMIHGSSIFARYI